RRRLDLALLDPPARGAPRPPALGDEAVARRRRGRSERALPDRRDRPHPRQLQLQLPRLPPPDRRGDPPDREPPPPPGAGRGREALQRPHRLGAPRLQAELADGALPRLRRRAQPGSTGRAGPRRPPGLLQNLLRLPALAFFPGTAGASPAQRRTISSADRRDLFPARACYAPRRKPGGIRDLRGHPKDSPAPRPRPARRRPRGRSPSRREARPRGGAARRARALRRARPAAARSPRLRPRAGRSEAP